MPYIYWIPKMHKNHYKRRLIADSSAYSTKPLSILLNESQASNHLIFRPFAQPSLTRNLKAGSQLSYGTPSVTKIVIGDANTCFFVREEPYFVNKHSDSKSKHIKEDIIKMLEFLVDNIFVVFAGNVLDNRIPMGTNCAHLQADIFLYSYEATIIQSLLSIGKNQEASQFHFTYGNMNDVLSINNPYFDNHLESR